MDETLSARSGHTAVWTGKEMIVWGGSGDGGLSNTGGRYDPATDTWRALSTLGAPSARWRHTAVWTGKEMIVWGGVTCCPPMHSNTGGRYDPDTDTWAAISLEDAPSARSGHTAVWTGSEMLVWGGSYYDRTTHYLNTGGRYDPETDTWTATNTVGAPSARDGHTAVWTGTEMIVWGGCCYLNTGGRYDPETDTWAATRVDETLSARFEHTAVWTDTEMIVWGGGYWDNDDGFVRLNTGGRYCASAGIAGQLPR